MGFEQGRMESTGMHGWDTPHTPARMQILASTRRREFLDEFYL